MLLENDKKKNIRHPPPPLLLISAHHNPLTMHYIPSSLLVALLSLVPALTPAVQGAIFPTSPTSSSTCTIGRPCSVRWTDSSASPHAKNVGPTNVDLLKGRPGKGGEVVQSLGGVANPGFRKSLSFTPSADLTPDDD